MTTREIGAYLCGARLHAAYDRAGWPNVPSTDHVAAGLAREDAEVMASMGERAWWRFFWMGWDEHTNDEDHN